MGIKIELKKEGIPIEIGGLEFFFSLNINDLKYFYDVKEKAENEINALNEEIEALEGKKDRDSIFKKVELTEKCLKVNFDALLGEGAFEQVQTVSNDPIVLEKVLDQLNDQLASELEKVGDKQTAERLKLKAKYMKMGKKK